MLKNQNRIETAISKLEVKNNYLLEKHRKHLQNLLTTFVFEL